MSRIRRESNIRIFITRRKNPIQRDIHNSAQLSNFNQPSRKSRFEPILVFEGKRKRKREKGVRSKGEGEEKERIHSTEETIAFIHSRTIHVRRREAENARAIAYDLSFCSSPSHPTESPSRETPTRRRRRHCVVAFFLRPPDASLYWINRLPPPLPLDYEK